MLLECVAKESDGERELAGEWTAVEANSLQRVSRLKVALWAEVLVDDQATTLVSKFQGGGRIMHRLSISITSLPLLELVTLIVLDGNYSAMIIIQLQSHVVIRHSHLPSRLLFPPPTSHGTRLLEDGQET